MSDKELLESLVALEKSLVGISHLWQLTLADSRTLYACRDLIRKLQTELGA